jgi:hypothetical protein
MKRVIIDTDADIDDWMATLFLLNHPDIQVEGISVVGTGACHLGPGTQNMLDLLQLAGHPDIPVAMGFDQPIRYKHEFPASVREPVDQVFGIELPHNPNPPLLSAVDFLYEKLTNTMEKLSILAIGPLTNLGPLLKEHPDIITTNSDRCGQIITRDSGPTAKVFFSTNALAYEDLFLATLNQAKTPRDYISFVLDGELVEIRDESPQTLLVDYLHRTDVGNTR